MELQKVLSLQLHFQKVKSDKFHKCFEVHDEPLVTCEQLNMGMCKKFFLRVLNISSLEHGIFYFWSQKTEILDQSFFCQVIEQKF